MGRMVGWSFPNIQEPFVTEERTIAASWRRFLQQIFDGTNSRGLPLVSVTPGASPWTYDAAQIGVLYVSGGNVSLIQLIRGGTAIPTGITSGGFVLQQGDSVVVTYSVAPTVNFSPG